MKPPFIAWPGLGTTYTPHPSLLYYASFSNGQEFTDDDCDGKSESPGGIVKSSFQQTCPMCEVDLGIGILNSESPEDLIFYFKKLHEHRVIGELVAGATDGPAGTRGAAQKA